MTQEQLDKVMEVYQTILNIFTDLEKAGKHDKDLDAALDCLNNAMYVKAEK